MESKTRGQTISNALQEIRKGKYGGSVSSFKCGQKNTDGQMARYTQCI